MTYVRALSTLGRGDVALAGGKGANLGELVRAGFPVPDGLMLTTGAYRAFVDGAGIGPRIQELAGAPDADGAADAIGALFRAAPVPAELSAELLDAVALLGDGPLAVRSSATAEDLEGASFAGQQETTLDVRGPDALLAAVRDCWTSLWTARAIDYRARRAIDPAGVALAVVVQRMVDADAAGVMFTANPATGRRDETVVSAAWGLGESVVGGEVSTDDVVVSMPGGTVRTRTTADKAVMTVPTGRGTEQRPVPGDRRTAAVLDDAAIAELAGLGARIADHFGAPQDVEWVRAGGEFRIVQSRPVTALPDPEPDPPTDWTLPDPRALYVRASIVEQLPDPLCTLFADLVDGSVTRSLQAMIGEILGRDVLRDGDVGLPTVNGYAYYRYSRAAMGRMLLLTPFAARVLSSSGRYSGLVLWRERAHPGYRRAVAAWADRPLPEISSAALMVGVVELLDAGTAYYTSVQTIIPIAVTSEITFTRFYETVVRRAGDPPATAFLLGFDSAPVRAEKSLYDLATWTRTRDDALAAALRDTPPSRIAALLAAEEEPAGVDPAAWAEWAGRFREHLNRHGHTVYNLDFVNAVPADDPEPLLATLRFQLGGGGSDPHERQRASAARRDAAVADVSARLDPVRRRVFTWLVRWAQAVAPIREDALADVGLAWPQLRRMLDELGSRLTADGVLQAPEDVYWLRRNEIESPAGSLAGAVRLRRASARARRRVTPPQLLPQSRWWARMEGLMPAASSDQQGPVLSGTGASPGRVGGTARVLAGPRDFARMQPGDVLVASITTPAWTPLFAMASGVVTDIGGPLSHSSIVAREYGIPAVLGTGVATRRIADGARVLVDGDAGTVTLLDEQAG